MKAEYYCPVLTIFKENGEIDYTGMHQIFDRIINAGLDGVILLGSSGEFYSLSIDKCKKLAKDCILYIQKKIKVYVGTGRMNLKETIELSSKVIEYGADGVIVVAPYYISGGDEGFYTYYDHLAKSVAGDIIIYNYPDRTGYDMSTSTILKLLENHNIIGIKDTVESATHTQNIINKVKPIFPNFKIFSGYDNNFIPVVLSGGDGCIAAISNIRPELCAKWVQSVNDGDFLLMEEIFKKINALMNVYKISNPFMPAMKKLLQIEGMRISDFCYLPAMKVNEMQIKEIEKLREIV